MRTGWNIDITCFSTRISNKKSALQISIDEFPLKFSVEVALPAFCTSELESSLSEFPSNLGASSFHIVATGRPVWSNPVSNHIFTGLPHFHKKNTQKIQQHLPQRIQASCQNVMSYFAAQKIQLPMRSSCKVLPEFLFHSAPPMDESVPVVAMPGRFWDLPKVWELICLHRKCSQYSTVSLTKAASTSAFNS